VQPPVSPGVAPGTAARPGAPAAPGAAATPPPEQLRIVADLSTNSLIIYGTSQEFQNIKNILKDLDAVPRQVLLDVLVAEVTLNNTENLGVDYEIKSGDTSFFGLTLPSRGSILTGVLANAITAKGFGAGISGVFGGPTVRALVNALKTDSRVKILSSPSVLASDNRPARIQVGTEEPIATGSVSTPIVSSTPTSTGFATSATVQYRNTGRIVTIIPQVNSTGLVNLQALVEVSQRGVNVSVGGVDYPSFDIRQAETSAVVQDGDTLAIGGIIAENKSNDKRGVPYLMDLPVFGRLFRSTSDTVIRTELVMLITPHVTRNRAESDLATQDLISKLNSVRNEL
jgi:general secretion pathway protein D